MIDTNVYLSRWPFRRLPHDTTPRLVSKLRGKGITKAWAGSFDGLLHKDISDVNARLAAVCQAHGRGLLVPWGSINPKLPDWQEDLRRCDEVHHMQGIRLHPNYHGYTLADPIFAALLDAATQRKLIVQIALRMEDPRTQHPLLQVPDVDVAPLADIIAKHPKANIVLLNCFSRYRADVYSRLAAVGNVAFEIATKEAVGGVAKLLEELPPSSILFGSYFPFFYFESAELKLRESALPRVALEAITRGNAERVLRQGRE